MPRNSEVTFDYSFVSDSSCSYLVLEYSDGIKLLNHQIEIISQNPISALVSFYVRREDEYTRIYYNITSKISLSQYLERKRMDKKELLDLLKNITKNLMLHTNYLLELSGYVLNLDFIYINPATAEVSLIYIPISGDRDSMKAYSSFLKDLIVNSASIDDNAKDNYLQRILNYLKSDTFGLNDFSKLIIELRNSGDLSEEITKATNIYDIRTINDEIAVGNLVSNRSPQNNLIGKTSERKYIVSIVLLQLLIVIAASITCLLLISQKIGDLVSISGVLLIAIAMDILVIRRISGKHDKQNFSDEAGKAVTNKQMSLVTKGRNKCINPHKEVYAPEQRVKRVSHQAIAPADNEARSYDTILISDTPIERNPYLESMGIHAGEKVLINKDKFIIGRLGSLADHVVQGNTIGKLHAEITCKEGSFCIRDLNSRNGTYINGVRIISNKECEIRNNDKIRLSDYEYVFKQQAHI